MLTGKVKERQRGLSDEVKRWLGGDAEKDPGCMSGKDARPPIGKGGGHLGRQWPGLGHVECNMCRVSEERPSKATGNGKSKAAPWKKQ